MNLRIYPRIFILKISKYPFYFPFLIASIFHQILYYFFYPKKYIFVAVLTKLYNHARHCNKSKKNNC